MSLSALQTALLEYVGDVLVNECNRPVPDRLLRYHTQLPDDCCTPSGALACWWERGYPSTRFPNPSTDDCPTIVYPISLRYVVCWKGIDVTPEARIVLVDDEWDADSAVLADVADVVTRALMRLSCGNDWGDPFVAAIYENASRKMVRWTDTQPVRPSGFCAGVLWRLYAAVRRPPEVS